MGNEYTLSANTLFHFTNSSDNLLGILKNEFYPRYCLENFALVLPTIEGYDGKELIEIAIPIVSFCDIPLSQIRNHVRYYGCYAIGLTKEWGIKNNICPVLYTYNNSEISNLLKTLLIRAINGAKGSKKINTGDKFTDWVKLVRYVKQYEGYLWRGGKYLEEKTKFYDEREWRFCPDIVFSDMIIGKENYLTADKIINANKELEKFKLSFEPKDIKYIIVDKDAEVLDMANKVIQIKQRKYTHADLQLLTTRIISREHIFEDF
jgi:hypothetical protein